MSEEVEQQSPPGWYERNDRLGYWDGQKWLDIEPPARVETDAKTILWGLALALGVAGVLGWDAPVIAYYWPMGLGGAGIAVSLVARQLRGKTPGWAILAVLASVAALVIGLQGQSDLNDSRSNLEDVSSEIEEGF
jgi:hypothetical protein